MAGERTLPGIALRAFHTPGSDDWNDTYDPDLRKLSVLVQPAVISRTTNLPASPVNGNIYIVPTGQTNANQIAVRDDGEWIYYVPNKGFLVHVNDEDIYVRWSATSWVPLSGQSLVREQVTANYSVANSDLDGSKIKTINAATAVTVTVPAGLSGDQPCQFIQMGAGQITFAGDSGVTLKSADNSLVSRVQFSSATLIPDPEGGQDTYVLVGDLVS